MIVDTFNYVTADLASQPYWVEQAKATAATTDGRAEC